ncbi:MAG: iron-containing alcohol dehydrogenase [Deltaproteobacteria bacterium]|nr:iron-containing alcohol dehydrogenase [Deltaproteobacteria bacterium]
MQFEWATPTRIIFGPGAVREAGNIAAEMGKRVFVVTGKTLSRATPLLEMLAEAGLETVTFQVAGEPTTDRVWTGLEQARAANCDSVIGFGGGSPLDAGKAISGLLTNPGRLMDYLEIIGSGKQLKHRAAPYMAIPTTAGTGTEVTRNAVLTSPAHKVKVSLRSPLLIPRVALVDPELTCTLPPAITASTGLDAFTQVLEPFVCNKPNPFTDAVCREGLRRAARSLRQVCEQGEDKGAREDLALVSLFGGLALANAGLGAVHGFAASLGGMFPAPHGAICARLLPHVMAANVRALQVRQPHSEALARYEEIARILTGQAAVTARDGVMWVQELCEALNIPPLAAHGMHAADILTVIEKAARASSMKANPVRLTPEEMQSILEKAL